MKHKTPIIIASIAVIGSLVGGMYFTRIDQKLFDGTFTEGVQSQAIDKPAVVQLSAEEKLRIQNRIEVIKVEIKKEQNDPERAIELRTELFALEQQLEGQE